MTVPTNDQPDQEQGMLIGMKAISRYCGISIDTVYSWRKKHNFPVCSLPDGRVATDKWLISQWILARHAANPETRQTKRRKPSETDESGQHVGKIAA